MQTRQQQTEEKKIYQDARKKKKFILCKPHRARAQPRWELGRNRVVTVGIENKEQKHFSLLSTAVFTFLFRGRWQQTERKKLLRFTVGENHNDHFRWWWNQTSDFPPCGKITLELKGKLRWTATCLTASNTGTFTKRNVTLLVAYFLTTWATTNRWPRSLPA